VSQQRSIKTRLKYLVLGSVGAALAIVAVLNCWQQANLYLLAKRDSLLATATVFSAAASKAVAANDPEGIVEAIRGMARVPGLLYAQVDDPEGKPITELGSAARLSGDLDLSEGAEGAALSLLLSRTVQVSVPIINAGQHVGKLVLVSDSSGLFVRLWRVLLATMAGSAIAAGLGLLIAWRLQRSIARPLIALTRAMAKVKQSHNYDARIDTDGDQEISTLASGFNSMMSEIRKRDGEIADASREMIAREEEMILRLSRAAESRDDQTGEHIKRMAEICLILAQELGMDARSCAALHRAAPMHDVGKIGVPDAILFKPGRLDPEERKQMEKHAAYGYDILRDSNSALIQLSAEIALTHHEKWDGGGYPRGLKGEEIPLTGRIAAVADVIDALASPRPYKEAWPLEAVQKHMVENAGSHFDPGCIEALLRRWTEVANIYLSEQDGASRFAPRAA
jgi:response regulator RpfG family c-di-GMP phosphodiesterase